MNRLDEWCHNAYNSTGREEQVSAREISTKQRKENRQS